MAAKLPILAKAFPPGDFIREELEDRGWTQQQLADRMGRPLQTVNMIVNGRKAITAETASQLEDVFGPSAIYWMNLESTWQLYKLSQQRQKIVDELTAAVLESLSPSRKIGGPRRRTAIKPPLAPSLLAEAGVKMCVPKVAMPRNSSDSRKKAYDKALTKTRKRSPK
jgi:addiction module HigA family antidote